MRSNVRSSETVSQNANSVDASQLNLLGSSFTSPPRGRRRRPDRGLPDENSRKELARTYLEEQSKHCPELVKSGILPAFTEENVELLAEDLRRRFLGEPGLLEMDFPAALILGAVYLRFSDPGSNPRSLDQQLFNVLVRARQDGLFIPWVYVFADSGVTGTIASRRGYQMAKQLMEAASSQVRCLYIDEVGRMSRDVIETLQLFRVMEAKGRRLVGASDGIDSSSENFKLWLTINASLHERFIVDLRKKVKRGMRDAFLRKRNIRPPSVAYKLVPILNPDGSPVLTRKGTIDKDKVINPLTIDEVLRAARRLTDELWSPRRIAKDWSQRAVGGKTSWDHSSIVQVLECTTHIGLEIEGKTRRVVDPQTGRVTRVDVPESEWVRREVPHLRIMDDELFFRVQARLREISEAFRRRRAAARPAATDISRAEVYPNLLLRPYCKHCKQPLSLGSSGKYSTFCCLAGVRGWNSCPLGTYKSIRIVEKVVLSFLRETAFTAEFVSELVRLANLFLTEEARRPQQDPKPLQRRLKVLKRERKRLAEAVAAGGELDSLLKAVRHREKAIKQVRLDLHRIQTANIPVPEPLCEAHVLGMLDDLKALLEQDIAAAAPVLRECLGRIEVEPGPKGGSKRPVWMASLNVNLVPVLLHLSTRKESPTAQCLEFLTRRNWKFSREAHLTLTEVPLYELHAPRVVEMVNKGTSREVIARTLELTVCTVNYAYTFGSTGARPKSQPSRKRTGKGPIRKFQAIAEEVVRLRHEEHLHFKEIAKRLHVSEGTVRRAYDLKSPDAAVAAAEDGKRPKRGRSYRLSPEVYERMRQLLLTGLSDGKIARQCGCSANTVRRERERLQANPEQRRAG